MLWHEGCASCAKITESGARCGSGEWLPIAECLAAGLWCFVSVERFLLRAKPCCDHVCSGVEWLSFLGWARVWCWPPHVRLSGAAAFETAKVRSPDFPTLEVSETNFVGGVGAGFSLYSAAKRIHSTRRYVNSLAFRLTAEGGYQLVGDIPFEVPKSAPSGSIPRRAISLGKLEQSGPYLRISAGAHF